MPNQADFHEFMNLRRAERHREPLSGPFAATTANPVPSDPEPYIEPWTGWRLVLAWTIAWLLSAGILALTVTLAYELIVWAAGV